MKEGSYHGGNILQRIVAFCRLLREHGVHVAVSETLDAATVMSFVDFSQESFVYNGLKTALVKRPEDYPTFDHLFEQYWLKREDGEMTNPTSANPLGRIVRPGPRSEERDSSVITVDAKISPPRGLIKLLTSNNTPVPESGKYQEKFGIYSPAESLGEKTFGVIGANDRIILKRGLKTFARKMATRPGRRFRTSRDGDVDFRRSFRDSLKIGGEIVAMKLVSPKMSKSSLVFLCDISGSMDLYSQKMMRLLHCASNTIRGTTIFAFSTRLVSLDKFLQGKTLQEAANLVSKYVDMWGSGTRIGYVLNLLLAQHAGILRPTSVFVIISDGWELGDLDLFKEKLGSIKRRVARLVWINPQADSPDFSPQAAGMKTALPLIDFFSGLEVFSNRTKLDHAIGQAIQK